MKRLHRRLVQPLLDLTRHASKPGDAYPSVALPAQPQSFFVPGHGPGPDEHSKEKPGSSYVYPQSKVCFACYVRTSQPPCCMLKEINKKA